MKALKKKTVRGETFYLGRAALVDHTDQQFIVVALDDACLQRAVTKLLMDPKFKINTKLNKTVRVTETLK